MTSREAAGNQPIADRTGLVLAGELGVAGGVGEHGAGDVAEAVVVASGVAAHQLEGRVDVDAMGRGQRALGLLDGDPAA